MKLTITNLEPYKSEVEIVYPSLISDSQAPLKEVIHEIGISTPYGKAHDIFLKDLWLSYSTIALENNFRFSFQYDFRTVMLQFMLSGNSLTEILQKGDNSLTYFSNQYNILFYSEYEAQHEHIPAECIEMVRIHVNPLLFLRLLPENKIFDSFRKDLENGNLSRLSRASFPITPEMLVIIREIQNLQNTGFYRRWIIEAKVIELLMLQFEQYEQYVSNPLPQQKGLRKKDIEIMQHARDIIVSNIHSPCSLIELARQVGTNEFHLKKTFKEVFGTTVFGYLFQQRMEEAKKLLLSGEMNVSQISLHLGYKNANHFSVAFKKQYGYSPSELRKI